MSTPDSSYQVTYRDFCDARMAALYGSLEQLRAIVDSKFLSSEKALAVALVAQERRLDLLNEFRAQMQDQAMAFARRDLIDVQMISIDKRLRDLEKFQSNIEGRIWAFGIGITILSMVIGVVLKFI
jgi:hypothetical protein